MATIRVNGEGRASGKANEVRLTVTVNRTEKDGAEAVNKVNARVGELRKELASAGFDGEQLRTNGLWVTEEFENVQQNGAYSRKFKGYACREELMFELPYTAERLTAAVRALGGEELNLQFSSGERETLKKTALQNAYHNALQKAEALAQASGKRLGSLLSLADAESRGNGSLALRREAAVALSAAAADVAPSDVSVTACVAAEWELQ